MSIPLERAWHFVGATLRDGRPVPPDRDWLVHDGPVTMCESGLHVAPTPWDALQYAPGAVLCHVSVEDIVARQPDKWVVRRRRIDQRCDVTDLLRAFARTEALSVIHLWEAPDVVRRYLETGDETIRAAARAAAWDAARAAAWDAASAAASAAAWAAARAAAWDAASAAAWAAASAAARAAAWDAARDAASAAARDAASAAAWDAASAAAWDAASAAAWAAARAAAWDAASAAARARFNTLAYAQFGVTP